MKHISKTVLLLALLAAVTILAGCPKEPEIPEQTSPSPGTWIQVESIPAYEEDPENCFFYSSDTKSLTFHYDSSDQLASIQDFPVIEENHYRTFDASNAFSDQCTGFEATVKKTSGYSGAGYGFCFDCIDDTDRYFKSGFILELCNSEYRYYCKYVDSESEWHTHYFTNTSNHWVSNSHINPVGTANKVKVFTKSDGKIALYINDYLIQEVTPPADYAANKEALINEHPDYPTGKIYVRSGVEFRDFYSTNPLVVINFKFNKLQTQP